uniref:HMG box domain-containing protein n=1 Tax=Ascaris lumbricoides TaxID=6252 RepID=A0A0M3IM12_ASCLU
MFTASYATVILLPTCAMTIFTATVMLCAQNPSRNNVQQRVEKNVRKPRKFKPKTKEEKKAFKAIAEGNVCDEKGNSTIEDARSDWGEVQKVLKASSKDTHSQMSQNSEKPLWGTIAPIAYDISSMDTYVADLLPLSI